METPPAPGDDAGIEEADVDKQLVDTKCSMCHTLDRVYAAEFDRDGWIATIDRMKGNGLVVTDEEYDRIVEFLAGR